MKINELRLKNTLTVIRSYKTGKGGNYFELMDAAKRDAITAIGANPAFMFIADKKAGNEWSKEEIAAFDYAYTLAVRDASKAIIDRAYKAIPLGIKKSMMFRAYLTGTVHYC